LVGKNPNSGNFSRNFLTGIEVLIYQLVILCGGRVYGRKDGREVGEGILLENDPRT
jgi:hypothetical protein